VPTLTRMLLVLILLGAIGYGAIYSLATFVEPREREITVRVKKEGFGR
jgi:type II secretory pathway pseudopilin PulG